MKRYLQIAKVNLKLSLLPHIMISAAFLCISPLLMGVENLNAVRTAQVLEIYTALLGIILLTPIFLPEQNQDIKDLIGSKFTPITTVVLIRLFEAMLAMMVFLAVFILFLKQNNCSFPEVKFYFGTLAGAVFLGGLGLCTFSITDQVAIAYMLPIFYYILNMMVGKKNLKDFYLFSMEYGSYQEKVCLAITGTAFIIIGIFYPYVSRRYFPKLIPHKS